MSVPQLQCGARVLPLSPAVVMGIVNVTPDSFSDGGRYADPDAAVVHALRLVGEGAAIVDLGGESTRPGADEVDADTEWARIGPVLQALRPQTEALISIDTTKAAVAAKAVAAGADMINDVSGGQRDPELLDVVAASGAGLVLMHMRGTPATMRDLAQYTDVVDDVCRELRACVEQALQRGVDPATLVLDPGIGFAKTGEQSVQLMAGVPRLLALGYPVLVGPSRKSFLGSLLGRDNPAERVWGTAAAVAVAVAQGAQLIRVHDVAAMVDVVRVAHALNQAQTGEQGKTTCSRT